jgi:hypothetical protein
MQLWDKTKFTTKFSYVRIRKPNMLCHRSYSLLASAPKRGALYGMKLDFVKGRQQLLGPFSRS